MSRVRNFFESSRYAVLDGPTGSQLIARGFQADPVLWTAKAAREVPELLQQIHTDYLTAGADLITANTFRINPYSFLKTGLPADEALRQARQCAHASVAIATEAVEALPARAG